MIRYETCRVGEDGIYSCGHEHETVAEAMRCSVPDGGEFIRACESGVYRSLNDREFLAFLVALADMPWRSPGWG